MGYRNYKIQANGMIGLPRWELNVRHETPQEAINEATEAIKSLASVRGLMYVIVWDMETEKKVAVLSLKEPAVEIQKGTN